MSTTSALLMGHDIFTFRVRLHFVHFGTRRYGVPADAISVPADSSAAVVKFTISIPRGSCTNAKAKYSSSVVPPDPSVHF